MPNFGEGTGESFALFPSPSSGGGGSGLPLATQQYGPVGITTYNLTMTMTALDTTNLTLPYTNPANGIVDINVQVVVSMDAVSTTGLMIGAALFAHGTTTVVGSVMNYVMYSGHSGLGLIEYKNLKWHLISQPVGPTQLDFAAAISDTTNSNSGQIYAGSGPSFSLTNYIAPFIMQAYASV